MDPILKQTLDDFGKTVAELRGETKKASEEFGSLSKSIGDTVTKQEKIHTRLDEIEKSIAAFDIKSALDATNKKLADALEEFEAKLNRLNVTGKGGNTEKTLHQKAFDRAIRKALNGKDFGVNRSDFTPDEVKALIVGNDLAGGYLAPLEFVNTLMDVNMVEISPIRPLCGRRTTSRQGIEIPTLESHTEATWVGETTTRSEQVNPSFGKREIKANEQLAKVLVSQQDLEDSIFDVEAMLRQEFAMQFGVSENRAFLDGNGAGKPMGMLVDTRLNNLATGATNVIVDTDMLNLQTSLKSFYMANARYVFSRLTLRFLRSMKDGMGQFMWQPSYQAGVPTLIAGFPYTVAVDMPDIATGQKPVIFGDFRQGYLIVDRLEMQVQTNPYSSMEAGMVQFIGRRRVGGQVVVPEALTTLTVA